MPTLPNTTAALRATPRRFARFIALPLKRALNSAGDMVSNARAIMRALPLSRPTRDLKAGSVSSLENLMLFGLTSWEVCWYNRFSIPLRAGARSVAQEGAEGSRHGGRATR
ncbi:hypothetical protein [Gemmatimonas sp.]|uniref:hypothetical protein n=1 Tax=Gemmatimonas sp. TaxID=1962908 RepID=UPI00286E03EC|nr:hypothetical protein [Gemmatimonas sp.]